METVDAIAAMPPTPGDPDRPDPVAMTKVTVAEPVTAQSQQKEHAHDPRHHRHRDRRHRDRPLRRERPQGAQNFIDLAKKGFYDDVIFHRVIPGFVIQGGDGQYGKKSSLERGRVGTGGPGYKFEDEPVKGDYAARLAGDGQRRPEHERQPVLHLHRRPDRPAAEELHALRPGDARASTSSTRSSSAPRDGQDLPNEPVAMTEVTIHED